VLDAAVEAVLTTALCLQQTHKARLLKMMVGKDVRHLGGLRELRGAWCPLQTSPGMLMVIGPVGTMAAERANKLL
jgi:hypothetical protein